MDLVMRAPFRVSKIHTAAKRFPALKRNAILEECKSQLHDLKPIAQKHKISLKLLAAWMKKAGIKIPPNQTKIDIVEQCISGKLSTAQLAKKYGIHVQTIRHWVKDSGKVVPRRGSKKTSTKSSSSKNQVHIVN